MAVLVGLIIVGGIKSIANIVRLVPFMVVIYVVMTLLVLALNFSAIPAAFGLILSSAFSMQGVSGGFIGIMILANEPPSPMRQGLVQPPLRIQRCRPMSR